MQIHELTKLTEAGVMDYLKAAVSRDPALANMSYDQKIKAMQNDESMKKLAQVASQNWINKTVNLQRANMGQPISDQEYTANLTDFVNKVMLGGQMSQLDPTSKARVDQAIQYVASKKNAPKELPAAFQSLAVRTSAARMQQRQPKGQRGGNNPATPPATTPATPPATATTPATPAQPTPAQIRQQKQAAAATTAQQQMATNPTATPAQTPAQIRQQKQTAAAGAAQQQMAGGTTPTATPEPASAPAAPVKPNSNEFAEKITKMFDEFADADGSTGSPAVRSAIRNMWMRTGGTDLKESRVKKKKKTIVVESKGKK
jgi:hypothetical protein